MCHISLAGVQYNLWLTPCVRDTTLVAMFKKSFALEVCSSSSSSSSSSKHDALPNMYIAIGIFGGLALDASIQGEAKQAVDDAMV